MKCCYLTSTSPAVEEVKEILRHLNNKQAKEKVLKEIAKEICVPLAVTFNKWIEQGIFPSPLKLARVVPIFKKGNKSKCGKLRFE